MRTFPPLKSLKYLTVEEGLVLKGSSMPRGKYVKPFFLCASIHPVSCHDDIGSDVHVVGGSSIVRVHADGSHSYWRPDKADDDATEAR